MTSNHLHDDAIPAAVLDGIGRFLTRSCGFDTTSYKDAYVRRRIAIRVRSTLSPSPEAYLDLLFQDPDEPDMLLKVLKIHVSQFFRNPATFDRLRSDVLPQAFAQAGPEGHGPLSVWSVGCAGGEEPYSVALLIHRYFPREWARAGLMIEATDMDDAILEKARKGAYRAERLADVPEEMKSRYFTERDGRYHLSAEIRDMVAFRRSDIVQPGEFIPADLILCRNVLIYLERWQQLRIIDGFAESLRPGGFLVLGRSETILPEQRNRFETVSASERIYRRR